jgi:type IV pilus assembly protein PilM
MPLTLKSLLGRRAGGELVGLDIQPGFVAAVKAHVNGGLCVERAAVLPLAADVVREGEVINRAALTETLRELFDTHGLGKRVRVGVANQRTVMRTIELPPMGDEKELAAAVNFQAQDQVPMPLANAVLDFHPLGVIDTPDGPRERVVLVAAQRDMIESLLEAVREAGLHPEGVDLSAFALIRALYRPGNPEDGRVLYLNVDGLTNLAIADGPVCSFTRVVGSGLEGMAADLAERRGIPVTTARELISAFDLNARAPEADFVASPSEEAAIAPEEGAEGEPDATEFDAEPGDDVALEADVAAPGDDESAADEESDVPVPSTEEHEALESGASYAELMSASEVAPAEEGALDSADEDIRAVIENGIREICGEVRNSLDFHRAQAPGGEVSQVALSGAALEVGGFAEALAAALDIEVRAETMSVMDISRDSNLATHRLAVAAGLATQEAPR